MPPLQGPHPGRHRAGYKLELGALRFAIARTISEEPDAHKMSLAIARLANAVSRLALAEYGTRNPKPVIKYGAEWERAPAGGEKLVHYIWRPRPADFAERYMARIDDRSRCPPPSTSRWRPTTAIPSTNARTRAARQILPPGLPEWRRRAGASHRHATPSANDRGIPAISRPKPL